MLVYQRVPSQIIGVTADLPQHVSATGLCGCFVWIRLDIYIYNIYNISLIILYYIMLCYVILYFIIL